MSSNIKISSFSLAKGKQLTGDDFTESKKIDDLTISVLCDGVGSATCGAEAAKRVCNYLVTNFKNRPLSWSIEKSMNNFIKSINKILYEESITNYETVELVTTLCIVVIDGNKLYGANVGDSRIYLLRDDKFNQLSNDHTDEDMEGVLTSAIGLSKEVELYYFENIINENDKILLCSDGLYTVLNQEQIKENIILGVSNLVKEASLIENDDLPDDTTACLIEIKKIDETIKLKQQKLDIPKELKINDIIDGYKLIKSLIQNDRTWLCENKNIKYVIKFAPLEAIDDKKNLDLFVKEAWNAKRLKAGFFPKSVIPKNRSYRYYIMEYFDGINLKDYINKRKLSIDESITLTKTILKMSSYLLKFDLVHGDIKPENIIIMERDGKKVFKLIDFGSIIEIYSINTEAGTPSYLAPERFNGSSISEKSEIFSIGVTLYEVLTKKFPYGEIEPFQKPVFKSVKSPQKINNNIPLWLDSVILKAIDKDEKIRYQHYSEILYELDNPLKVKPFFDKNTPLLKSNPLLVYKIGFYLMLILNIILLIN